MRIHINELSSAHRRREYAREQLGAAFPGHVVIGVDAGTPHLFDSHRPLNREETPDSDGVRLTGTVLRSPSALDAVILHVRGYHYTAVGPLGQKGRGKHHQGVIDVVLTIPYEHMLYVEPVEDLVYDNERLADAIMSVATMHVEARFVPIVDGREDWESDLVRRWDVTDAFWALPGGTVCVILSAYGPDVELDSDANVDHFRATAPDDVNGVEGNIYLVFSTTDQS